MESATCCGMELLATRANGIKPQEDKDARLRVMPSAFGDSIQCASALMPYQVLRSCIKITASKEAVIFGDSWENRTPVSALRGPCLSRLTNEPCALLVYYSKTFFVCQYLFEKILQNLRKIFPKPKMCINGGI